MIRKQQIIEQQVLCICLCGFIQKPVVLYNNSYPYQKENFIFIENLEILAVNGPVCRV